MAGIDDLVGRLAAHDYVCDRRLATVLYLALRMRRPLYLEGEAGVGKTELAKALAAVQQAPLIRLQCYEGLDIQQAAYEWNVGRQLIEIRLAEALHETDRDRIARDIYRRELLIERPLLQALTRPSPPVLLIDELDRADEPFEAFLLEVLAEYQITIPELGAIRAEHPPIVVITSNRTREIRDALKRRCLYHWVDYPDAPRELEIVRRRAPGASERLAGQAVDFVQRMRKLDLFKLPGVAETIDWTNALVALNVLALEPDAVRDTLGVLLKYQEDVDKMLEGEAAHLLDQMRAAAILR
ncbi:MAG TPA: MoxR family ATPase [Burkholderiaceae bacterium]|nr:MoxR family ATPase [Burkholderiaceae bacterium]